MQIQSIPLTMQSTCNIEQVDKPLAHRTLTTIIFDVAFNLVRLFVCIAVFVLSMELFSTLAYIQRGYHVIGVGGEVLPPIILTYIVWWLFSKIYGKDKQ